MTQAPRLGLWVAFSPHASTTPRASKQMGRGSGQGAEVTVSPRRTQRGLRDHPRPHLVLRPKARLPAPPSAAGAACEVRGAHSPRGSGRGNQGHWWPWAGGVAHFLLPPSPPSFLLSITIASAAHRGWPSFQPPRSSSVSGPPWGPPSLGVASCQSPQVSGTPGLLPLPGVLGSKYYPALITPLGDSHPEAQEGARTSRPRRGAHPAPHRLQPGPCWEAAGARGLLVRGQPPAAPCTPSLCPLYLASFCLSPFDG